MMMMGHSPVSCHPSSILACDTNSAACLECFHIRRFRTLFKFHSSQQTPQELARWHPSEKYVSSSSSSSSQHGHMRAASSLIFTTSSQPVAALLARHSWRFDIIMTVWWGAAAVRDLIIVSLVCGGIEMQQAHFGPCSKQSL